jgi:hypothetical protein
MRNDNSRGPEQRPSAKALSLEHDLVEVAPQPVFARLEGLYDGVLGVMKMLAGVFVFGGVAAADVAAFAAKTEMHPAVAGFEAFFAALTARLDVLDLALMSTGFAHEGVSWF